MRRLLRSFRSGIAWALGLLLSLMSGQTRRKLFDFVALTLPSHYAPSYYWHLRSGNYLSRQFVFSEHIESIGESLAADAYICLLPDSVLAGVALREQFGGIVVCDQVENIRVDRQTVAPALPQSVLRLANHAAVGALSDCDRIMTIGNELGKRLASYEKPLFVLENFRLFEEPSPDYGFFRNLGIPSDATIVLLSGSVVEGYRPFLTGFAQLPNTYHAVALCNFPRQSDRDAANILIKDLGLGGRVYLRDQVPYEDLLGIASAAHIGAITNSVENPNAAVGLPNRFFDFLAAGLPVVSTNMPDVAHLVEKYDVGEIVSDESPERWSEAITQVSNRSDEIRANVRQANLELRWESREEELVDFLSAPRKVTILSFRDPTRDQRPRRIARTLTRRGIDVDFFFESRNPDFTRPVPGARYFWVEDVSLPFSKVMQFGANRDATGGN